SPGFQRAVADALARARLRTGPARPSPAPPALPQHPVDACPDRRRHLRALERSERLAKDVRRLERLIHGRTEARAGQFDGVWRGLRGWGYVEVGGWALTAGGEQLTRLYHEADLLIAEAVRAGLFDELDPSAVAALASAFTYETRGPAAGAGGGD